MMELSPSHLALAKSQARVGGARGAPTPGGAAQSCPRPGVGGGGIRSPSGAVPKRGRDGGNCDKEVLQAQPFP